MRKLKIFQIVIIMNLFIITGCSQKNDPEKMEAIKLLALKVFLKKELKENQNFNLKDAVEKFDFNSKPTDTVSTLCRFVLQLKDLETSATLYNGLNSFPTKLTEDKKNE